MGTGFGEGGVCTPGGCQKNFGAAFGGADTGGVEFFFQGVILLVDPGVILPKIVKLGVPSGPPGTVDSPFLKMKFGFSFFGLKLTLDI